MNKESFNEWKSHPATKEIFAKLEELKDSLKDSLASGNTLATTADETALLTARVIGQVDGLNQILGLEYKTEEDTDNE